MTVNQIGYSFFVPYCEASAFSWLTMHFDMQRALVLYLVGSELECGMHLTPTYKMSGYTQLQAAHSISHLDSSRIAGLRSKPTRLVWLYLTALAVSFSPLESLALLLPILTIVGLVFFVQLRPKHHIKIYTIIFGIYLMIGVLYKIAYSEEFSYVNYLFFGITSSSFLIMLYDFRLVADSNLMNRLAQVTFYFLIVQSLIGFIQVMNGFASTGTFDTATGDFVQGTLTPWILVPRSDGSNQTYAILVSSLLLYLLGCHRKNRGLIWIGVIVTAWVFASVMHTIIFLVISLLTVVMLSLLRHDTRVLSSMMKRRILMFVAISGILVIGTLFILLPKNISTIEPFLKLTLDYGPNALSPKTIATYNTLEMLPKEKPLVMIWGLGPGQYSSRASLILSGEYLQNNIPLPTHINPYAQEFILNLWIPLRDLPGNMRSSTLFPYYSWLSLYGETGLFGLILLLAVGHRVFRVLWRTRFLDFPYLGFSMVTLLLYLALLGVQDNYWEWTPAVFPCFFLLKLTYSYANRTRYLDHLKPEKLSTSRKKSQ